MNKKELNEAQHKANKIIVEENEKIEIDKFVKFGMSNDTLSKADLLYIIAKKNVELEAHEEEVKKLSELFTRLLRSDLDLLLDNIDEIKKIGISINDS